MIPKKTTIDEVEHVLHERREDYELFLKKVLGLLSQLPLQKEFRNLIHRVYSRADRQLGASFKDTIKIARALEKLKVHDPQCRTVDVKDIIGVTIVCPYPSNIVEVLRRLEKLFAQNALFVADRRHHEREDYIATHCWIQAKDARFHGLFCEVQIKTMLFDAWNAKTHDLTYKPSVIVDEKLNDQMNKLLSVLRSLDQQSELIREQIMQREELDRIRRMATRRSILTALDGPGTTSYDEANDIIELVKQQQEIVADCELDEHPAYKAINRAIRRHRTEGPDQNLLRACAYLASSRDRQDLDAWLMHLIDNWIHRQADPMARVRAWKFKATALLTLDRLRDAIETNQMAMNALHHAQSSIAADDFNTAKRTLHLNAAYYIAELCSSRSQDEADLHAKEALQLVSDHFDQATASGGQCDTAGLVYITFGQTEEEIRLGLELIRLTLARIPADHVTRPCAEAFVELHERRAYKRLLELPWKRS